ncbi:MAG: hypothetical protein NPIRA02_00530 [Nitrospirales bacterium]|nr:MAG: hypothetical protein NPIRA02_00530 [Nitrospirales bacterium]
MLKRQKPSDAVEDEDETDGLAPARGEQRGLGVGSDARPNDCAKQSSTVERDEWKEVQASNESVDPGEICGDRIRVSAPESRGEDERAERAGERDSDFMARMREFLIEAGPATEEMEGDVADRSSAPPSDEGVC